MSNPYIGEIRMFGGNYAPLGWMFCNGQLLSVTEYESLFSLIGTTYGGDGVDTFALPNLQGRVPIHQDNTHSVGEAAGVETVTLLTAQIPSHTHALSGSVALAEGTSPSNAAFAKSADTSFYEASNPGKDVPMSPAVVTQAGGSLPHDNMQPFLCVTFIIAVEGTYPQQG